MLRALLPCCVLHNSARIDRPNWYPYDRHISVKFYVPMQSFRYCFSYFDSGYLVIWTFMIWNW